MLRVRRRLAIEVGIAGAAVVVLAFLVAFLAPRVIRGPRFGRLVEHVMPATCGRIHVGGGSWTWATVFALLRGRPAEFALTDLDVTDPAGTEVLRVRQLSGRLELGSEHRHIVVRDLRIQGALWRFAQMQGTAGKEVGFLKALELAGDGVPRCRPRVAPTGTRPDVGSFQIADAKIDGLDVVFGLPGWDLTLKDMHASGSLAVPNPGTSGGDVGFEVRDADVRGGGELGVSVGSGRLALPFSRASLKRVATTATRPDAVLLDVSGLMAGGSSLAATGAFTDVFDSSGPARPSGIDLQVKVDDPVDVVQAVLTRRVGQGAVVGGRGARLSVKFSGPFEQLKLDMEARGFDVKYRSVDLRDIGFRLSAEPFVGRLQLTHLSVASPEGGHAGIDAKLEPPMLTASVIFDHFATGPLFPSVLLPLLGGTLDGSIRGHIDLVAATAAADEIAITLARPAGVSGPRVVRITADDRAKGKDQNPKNQQSARDQANLLRRVGLSLRVSGARFVDGAFYLPQVVSSLWGGRVAARGKITIWDKSRGTWMPAPLFDVTLNGDRVLFEQLTGVGLVSGAMSFRARGRGPLENLELHVDFPHGATLQVIGQRFRLPHALVLHLNQDDLVLPDIQLQGMTRGKFTVAGKIGLTGLIDLGVTVNEFPIGSLPGLAQTDLPFGGRLTGSLRLSGERGQPGVTGQISIEDVTLAGHELGLGSVLITPGPSGGIRASASLGENVTARGVLVPGPDGLRGEATLDLNRLRLDRFLSTLPGGVTATGLVSGSATARIAPGLPPSIAGRLTELVLTLTRPMHRGSRSAPAAPAGSIDLRAVGDVPLSAVAAGGPIKVGPARFTGNAGSFELMGQTQNDKGSGTLRGRISLTTLGPLLSPWLNDLSGAMDFDLAVASTGVAAGARPWVTGNIVVAAPISVRPSGAPFGVGLPSGRIDFRGDRVSTENLVLTLGRGRIRASGGLVAPARGTPRMGLDLRGDLDVRLVRALAPGIIRHAEGFAPVNAHLEGTVADHRIKVRVDLPQPIEFGSQMLGSDSVKLGGGPIELDDRALTIRSLTVDVGSNVHVLVGPDGRPGTMRFRSLAFDQITQLDLPVRGSVTAFPQPFAQIDRGSFALRLSGDPHRRLRLAGDVELQAAHVSSSAAPKSGKPAGKTSSWLSRPEIARTELDVNVLARGGALVVVVPHAPDPHVNLNFHVAGTVGHPEVIGRITPSGIYSTVALWLYRLFRRG